MNACGQEQIKHLGYFAFTNNLQFGIETSKNSFGALPVSNTHVTTRKYVVYPVSRVKTLLVEEIESVSVNVQKQVKVQN